ncbi:Cytosolic seryl-tRNA synthetase, partial [Cryomyces antarcticus]
NKENADDLMKQKDDLQKKKKDQEDLASKKHIELLKKAKSIGNYVHDSVPISDNEVYRKPLSGHWKHSLTSAG